MKRILSSLPAICICIIALAVTTPSAAEERIGCVKVAGPLFKEVKPNTTYQYTVTVLDTSGAPLPLTHVKLSVQGKLEEQGNGKRGTDKVTGVTDEEGILSFLWTTPACGKADVKRVLTYDLRHAKSRDRASAKPHSVLDCDNSAPPPNAAVPYVPSRFYPTVIIVDRGGCPKPTRSSTSPPAGGAQQPGTAGADEEAASAPEGESGEDGGSDAGS
ncbi:hypothetical protein ACFL2Q_16325, partial [Thermodesulfobacteriota bacterium]